MNLKKLLKLCAGNKIAATLFGILVITIVSSMVFIQSVFGQTSIHQILETLQTPELFSEAFVSDDSAGASVDVTVPGTDHKESTAPEISQSATPVPALPSPIQESTIVMAAETTTTAPTATHKPTSVPKPTPAETVVAAAVTTAAKTAPPSSRSLEYGMASAVLDLANQQRTGLCALTWSDSLAATAQIRAKEIEVSFSHTRPDGSEWYTAGSPLAENIAKEQSSSAAVMQSWMASAAHAANITNAAYTQMGVACYNVNGICYWVQEFS